MKAFSTAKFLQFSLTKTEHTTPLKRTVLPYMDITYMISGQMYYHYNDTPLILRSGDAIVFPQGSIRERAEAFGSVHYASINIRFLEELHSPVKEIVPNAVKPYTVLQLEAMDEICKNPGEYADKICSSLTSALYYQLLSSASECQNSNITAMKQFITNHITQKLSLHSIADSVHWSPEYASTQFKKYTGQTVIEFVNAQKISTAKRMIMLGEQSLNEIAASLGFSEYHYFYRVFRSITGHSPCHYKKKH